MAKHGPRIPGRRPGQRGAPPKVLTDAEFQQVVNLLASLLGLAPEDPRPGVVLLYSPPPDYGRVAWRTNMGTKKAAEVCRHTSNQMKATP